MLEYKINYGDESNPQNSGGSYSNPNSDDSKSSEGYRGTDGATLRALLRPMSQEELARYEPIAQEEIDGAIERARKVGRAIFEATRHQSFRDSGLRFK